MDPLTSLRSGAATACGRPTPQWRKAFHRNGRGNLHSLLDQIEALGESFRTATDQELADQTRLFRTRLRTGETLDALLPEAFAVVGEAVHRILGMRLFPVQLLGGIVIHRGQIAEMVTGEGKTLVASLPAYLNALAGRGVHVITVNDYLARRDRDLLGPIYQFLGLSVGVIAYGMSRSERQQAYRCEITYGSNKEFGFDYLRDRLPRSREEVLKHSMNRDNLFDYLLHGAEVPPAERIQRELHYAIVDEADSVLIDEARTPLVLSGQGEGSAGVGLYLAADALARRMQPGTHFKTVERDRQVTFTEAGRALLERSQVERVSYNEWSHAIAQALRAHHLYQRDRDYIVRDGRAVIVDSFTGRALEGRVWQAGLHQAVESKEGIEALLENQTLISITYQNYFRKYARLSGMTGTAATEARELSKVYRLDVVSIPTNRPIRRVELRGRVYATIGEKLAAIVAEIDHCHSLGRPVLVGTISVAHSERLSVLLAQRDIPHQVLNAKQDVGEARVVANAGRFGAVTIATNMAGRGTDILLGGNLDVLSEEAVGQNAISPEMVPSEAYRSALVEVERRRQYGLLDPHIPLGKFAVALAFLRPQLEAEREKVLQLGGLHVIGSERHESRRIDNQLLGRAGRQGDPGSSQFYVSLEDEMMRLFLPRWVRAGLRCSLRLPGGVGGRALVLFAAHRAQRRAERYYCKIRGALLKRSEALQKWRASAGYDEARDRWKDRLV